MLRRHGPKYRETHPWGYGNYCAVAGVNAARLQRYGEARHYFATAIRVNPENWRHYVRFLLTLVPFLGYMWWLRYAED